MEFFTTWAIVLGLVIVPGLLNYYVGRYSTPDGALAAPKWELIGASLTLTFVILALDIFSALLMSLVWDGFRSDIANFVHDGLAGFARERPIALTGVLTAWSVSCMGLMALLGAFRIPGRYLR